MRPFRLLFVLTAIFVIPVTAQIKVTIDEAINMAFQKNIDLQKQFSIIKNAEIDLDGSERLPNPLFSYSREDLKSSFQIFDEWIASGSIPINFLWERWSNIESKEKSIEAEKLFYESLKWNISYKVREYYFALNNYAELSLSLDKSLVSLTILAESSNHRLAEGDISQYELQRILIELSKLKVTVSDIKLKKRKLENNLKLLIGFDAKTKLIVINSFVETEVNYSENELIQIALENRNDIKAAQLIIESENSYLSFNKLKIIPEINLTAGYKKQTDKFNGSVLQLDFEIPFFNRNQKRIKKSEVKLSILEKELLFQIEKIKTEVFESLYKYRTIKRLYKETKNLKFENIFTASSLSYKHGEISLVQFIDGINTFIDGLILENELKIKYHDSFFKLEKTINFPISNIENNLGVN